MVQKHSKPAKKLTNPAKKLTGQAKRDREELGSLRQIKARGTAPDICGDDILKVSPARGPVVPYQPSVLLPDGVEDYKTVRLGHRGRTALRQADAFDRMCAQSARRNGAAPFTRQQIGVARDYAALAERCASSGVKCSNLLATGGSGGGSSGNSSFIDAFMRDRAHLRRYHQAIGDATGLPLRRIRPSDRGTRHGIPDRVLVDQVCIGERTISEVLRAHGWMVNGRNIKALRAALCLVLDRMMTC